MLRVRSAICREREVDPTGAAYCTPKTDRVARRIPLRSGELRAERLNGPPGSIAAKCNIDSLRLHR
jgi:hypothetical protein